MDPDRLAYDLHLALVDSLASAGHIRAANVRAAFTAVRRHQLLPETNLADVYADRAITLKTAVEGDPLPTGRILSSATMPSLLARILEQAAIRPGMRVLQVGTGPGYLAALLSQMVGPSGQVVSVEIDSALSATAAARLARSGYGAVHCVVADGLQGYPSAAPYDRIIATASLFEVPPPWILQLSDDGVLVLPLSLAQRAGTYPMLWLKKDGPGLIGGVVDGLPRVGFLPFYGPGVVRPVMYEQSISELEASFQPQLVREATVAGQYGALWVTLLLEVATDVASDWDNRAAWNTSAILSRTVSVWRQLGKPAVADYIFRIQSRDSPIGGHRWRYTKGDHILLVSVEGRT